MVENWHSGHQERLTRPVDGSSLRGDDARTAGYDMSHAVKALIQGAIDHLYALKSLVTEAQVLHMCAPTLIRPAIEQACTVIWLLGPANRKVRVLRRLRLQYWDFLDGHDVQTIVSNPVDPDWLDGRRAKLKKIAEDAGLDQTQLSQLCANRTGYRKIVQYGAEYTKQIASDLVRFSWHACSGISHGSMWATLSVNQIEQIQNTAEDLLDIKDSLNLRMSANERFIEAITIVAAALIYDAMKLLECRGTNHLAHLARSRAAGGSINNYRQIG